MNVAIVSNNDGSTEVYFEQLNYWEEFEVILELLEKENGCQVVSEKDVGETRLAILKVKNVEFSLRHHYMFGNFLYTTNSADVPVLERLANNVIDSIKTKLKKLTQ
jgi:hypothetical protein